MTFNIKRYYSQSSGRSKEAMRNIVISFIARGVSMVCSLLIVPVTINYVNPTQYGIWLTLSSIIWWILIFDFGLGNGLRNKFAEAKANGNIELARQYVSTTYFTLGAIMLALFGFVVIVNQFVDWTRVLNVETLYGEELKQVFAIVSLFFCMSLVVNLFSTILTADQKPGLAAVLGAAGQFFSLLVIYLLTLFTKGNLFNMALYYSGVPMFVMLVASLYGFCFTRYKEYAPHWRMYRKCLAGNITGLGIQFFIICVSMIFIYQVMNIIISRELGPDAVTEYNIAYKYFNILTTVILIIVTPYWSAFTDAYCKKDYQWMKYTMRKLEIVWLLSCVIVSIMVLLANTFYYLWIGNDVEVKMLTTLSLAIYVSLYNLGQIYMYMVNGLGTVRIQLIIFLVFAFVAWPLMVTSCQWLGLPGIVIIPSLVAVLQALFGKIQITKNLSGSATGIWGR